MRIGIVENKADLSLSINYRLLFIHYRL